MKSTMRLARIVMALLPPPSQYRITGGAAIRRRAAGDARDQSDAEGERQPRRTVIAPARRQHRHDAQDHDGDAPAQHDRIEHDQKPHAERQPRRHRDRQRSHFAPGAAANLGNGKRRRCHKVDQQDRDGGDARIVDRGDQRHVDHRAAEAGEAAREAGQRRDRHGGIEAGLGEGSREGFAVGKIDHVPVPAPLCSSGMQAWRLGRAGTRHAAALPPRPDAAINEAA